LTVNICFDSFLRSTITMELQLTNRLEDVRVFENSQSVTAAE